MQNKARRILGLFLLCVMCLTAGCGTETPAVQPDTVTTTPTISLTTTETTTVPEVTAADTTTAPVTEETTAAPETETAAPETTESSETTTAPDSESEDSSSETESTAPAENEKKPEFVNPLTGLAAEEDMSANRPAAIMINNIKVSCPQEGVSEADIIYECLVEGGYTRLMMLAQDYPNLPEVGSVRSSRDYYLDFAADYDAIYVHAGGSPYAYTALKERGVHNLDGVNMYLPTTFYRDQERVKSMGLEHSLMTTGTKIVEGIKYKRYRTEIVSEDFDYPLDFRYGEPLVFEDAAKHVHIPYSVAQVTDFEYDEETGEYLRWQFNGVPHVDGANNEQLSFKNVLIYFCETGRITGDSKLRIEVGTVGEGTGFYAVNGTYTKITWKKDSHDTPIRFYGADGELLLMDPGKTFVSVCPTTIENLISFNYEK